MGPLVEKPLRWRVLFTPASTIWQLQSKVCMLAVVVVVVVCARACV